jgi:branched-chain amino acid transport system substrate-binding protein
MPLRHFKPCYRNWLLIVGLIGALILTACGDNTPTTVPAATTAAAAATTAASAATTAAGATSPAKFDGSILFGAPLSFTGSTSKEGNLSKEGYELWKDLVNSKGGIKVGNKAYEIKIQYYDDAAKQDTSAKLTDKLVKEDKVNFLLGPYGTAPTLADSTVAEENQIPMVAGNGTAEAIYNRGYKYTFGVLTPATQFFNALIDLLLTQNPVPQNIGILGGDDPALVELADGAKKYAEGKGLKVTYYQKYALSTTNFSSLITEVKGKQIDFLIGATRFNDCIAIEKAAKELDYNPLGIGFSVCPSLPDFLTTLKTDANFVMGGTQWTEALKYNGDDVFGTPQNYFKLYVDKFGHSPSYQSAQATASAVVFQKAIEKAGSIDPKVVRDTLAGLDFMSFYGPIKFDSRGLNSVKGMAVEQIQSGKKVTVWPKDAAAGPLLWPMPAWGKRT